MESLQDVFEVENNGLLDFSRLVLKLQSHCCKKASPERAAQNKPPLSRSTVSGVFNLQSHVWMTLTFEVQALLYASITQWTEIVYAYSSKEHR